MLSQLFIAGARLLALAASVARRAHDELLLRTRRPALWLAAKIWHVDGLPLAYRSTIDSRSAFAAQIDPGSLPIGSIHVRVIFGKVCIAIHALPACGSNESGDARKLVIVPGSHELTPAL